MKKHFYKRSELVLFFYESMLHEGITMKELMNKTNISVGTAYSLIDDIELYISDFYRFDLEILKIKDRYYINKKK